ncbi:hypothetical protein [Sulfurimonas sp.]|uniref:hypothetical protein n=1 Tax=Sulfurimonas sp. TaxID=2022749 RepID=UPI002615979B|nr:hypothetical protein [Sulfurimonas sp.]
MKIWISKTVTPTYKLIKLHCEQHSNYEYLGDLSDTELEKFFLDLKGDIDVQKNTKLLHYFGYLHLFITMKA